MNKVKRKVTTEGLKKIRTVNFDRWLQDAINKHKNKFNISESVHLFETQKSPDVKIICKKHNHSFFISPYHHLRSESGGCAECLLEIKNLNSLKKESKKFLEWFENNCLGRLEICSSFNGMTKQMSIRCLKHNTVKDVLPTNLMNTGVFGCDACAKESQSQKSRLNADNVLKDISYDLPDNVKVIGVQFNEQTGTSNVLIECEHHGKQLTTKGYLKRSIYKCPKCGDENVGYASYKLQKLIGEKKKGKPTYIGVMLVEVFGIKSLKVGVTTRTLEDRYVWNLKEIYFSVRMSEVDAYILENQIHRKFRNKHDLRILSKGMRSGERWAGDTECYYEDKKEEIIDFIKSYFDRTDETSYENELKIYEVPDFFPRDSSREKDLSNIPQAVVGINPDTNRVVVEFDSISDANRAGYKNISMVIIESKYNRRLSGGLRWFRKSEFDQYSIPELRPPRGGKPVRCIETNQVFRTTQDAADYLRRQGVSISPSHITSVCKGRRKKSGGYSWIYADESENL